jgi:hypothetical protein
VRWVSLTCCARVTSLDNIRLEVSGLNHVHENCCGQGICSVNDEISNVVCEIFHLKM